MTEKRDLAQVLADCRGDAAVLRRAGHSRDAELLETVARQVSDAAHEYLTWLSETDAMLRCGRSREWLRSRFPEWEREGHARSEGRGIRHYRALIVPRRAAIVQAAEAGRAAARQVRGRAA